MEKFGYKRRSIRLSFFPCFFSEKTEYFNDISFIRKFSLRLWRFITTSCKFSFQQLDFTRTCPRGRYYIDQRNRTNQNVYLHRNKRDVICIICMDLVYNVIAFCVYKHEILLDI